MAMKNQIRDDAQQNKKNNIIKKAQLYLSLTNNSKCDILRCIFTYKQIMRSKQQKQIDSGGEFEQIGDQIQTLNTQNFVPIAKRKVSFKSKQSEKLKLGVYPSTYLSEVYTPKVTKHFRQAYAKILKVGSATFRSNYECGHIGSVELIGINHYKIGLDYESNSARGNTWFNFTVEGIKGQAKFIIQGFTKSKSLYNNGMKICYKESKEGKWRRGGVNISYSNAAEDDEEKNYQLHFTYFFKSNQNSSVEFAYAFPYGLVKLQNLINLVQSVGCIQMLGRSYQGRDIPLITIGNPNSKQLIILSSRVHPGETCSSFIMQGLLKELISSNEHSKYLRQQFYFKIIPMINIDGVSSGNYRFSGAGVDLNRKWKQPSQQYHPQIFYLKQTILKESKQRKVRMYIDMHGHSRKKNVFFYGCYKNSDQVSQYTQSKAFPYLMSKLHSAFNYFDCSFNVQKEKQGTARVSMWKQLKIHEIFTLQASMCGSEVGHNYTECDYEKIGKKLCQGISIYFSTQAVTDNISIKKLSKFNQDILNALRSDPMLLKVGSFEGSESDSDPQKGQIPLKQAEVQSRQMNKRLKMASFHSNIRHMQKHSSNKQRNQQEAPQQKQLVKQKQLFEYFFDIPPQNFDKQIKPSTTFMSKRANSLSRNNNYKTAIKSITYNQQQNSFVQQKNNDKANKANLLVGWQGAQYRRVRKLAQQNWKRGSSMCDIEVKGLRSNKIQIINARSLIPKLALNVHQNRTRKNAAQMFFGRMQKYNQRATIAYDRMGVLCRGRQIPL